MWLKAGLAWKALFAVIIKEWAVGIYHSSHNNKVYIYVERKLETL